MMLVALIIDAAVGWPEPLFRRIGHPVTWIGAVIERLDSRFNLPEDPEDRRRSFGMLTSFAVISAALLPALLASALLPDGVFGAVLGGILAWPLVAARSLYTHVKDVAAPLAASDLSNAHRAVARIVGRNPETLDEAGVARAGLESLAENTSDGVVAPLFWGAIFGLPGIAVYKAINTLDSMIGHRTERFEDFGRFAAKLDDVVNYLPARLTGIVFAAVCGRPVLALQTMWRDAPQHRSPNAGWPEAALAAGLGIRLSGPRVYADHVADEPWLNASAPDPTPQDVYRGLVLYRRTVIVTGAALGAVALI